MRTLRAIAIVVAAFLVGAASTEGVVRLRTPETAARPTASDGAIGDLVSFELRTEEGATVARSRVVSPEGKLSSVVVRDPGSAAPRLVLQVVTARERSGSVRVNYRLQVPELKLQRSGHVWVKPGVESTLPIAPDLVAVFTAVPVPSKAFDRVIESERALRARAS